MGKILQQPLVKNKMQIQLFMVEQIISVEPNPLLQQPRIFSFQEFFGRSIRGRIMLLHIGSEGKTGSRKCSIPGIANNDDLLIEMLKNLRTPIAISGVGP